MERLVTDKNFYLTTNIFQWKGINCKQSTRWQHLSRLKASAFLSLQKKFSCFETQQLILGTGTAIWWVTEPHCVLIIKELLFHYPKGQEFNSTPQRLVSGENVRRPSFLFKSVNYITKSLLSLCKML